MKRQAEPGPTRRAARGRGRRAVAVAASLLLHALGLAALGLGVDRLRLAQPPEPPQTHLELRLETRRAVDGGAAAPSTRSAARLPAAIVQTAPATSPAASVPVPSPRTESPPAPAQPSRAAVPEAPGAVVSRGGSAGAGVGLSAGEMGALRGLLGCGSVGAMGLSPAERARCAARLALDARTAPHIDPIPAEKRKYYDAVAQAYAETHFYGTPSPWVGTRPGGRFKSAIDDWKEGVPPGHTAMAGCSPLFLLPGYKPRPHTLKLGPCVITPPRGTFTEEADIPDPPTLREREADAAHTRRLDPPKP